MTIWQEGPVQGKNEPWDAYERRCSDYINKKERVTTDRERVLADKGAEVIVLREALRECARLAGADLSDGFPTWPPLPRFAIEAVRQLRADYDHPLLG